MLTENDEIQKKVIDQLYRTVEDKGYAGVNIDFEYILPENRVRFAQFVGRVRKRMSAGGYRTSVALAPKVSDTQKGASGRGTGLLSFGRKRGLCLSDDL